MVGAKCFGVLAVVPTIVLFTISFFMMVVLIKLEEGPLKSFGRILAVLLCIIALSLFVMGMYVVTTAYCPIINMLGRCGVIKSPSEMMYEEMCKPPQYKSHRGMHSRHMPPAEE